MTKSSPTFDPPLVVTQMVTTSTVSSRGCRSALGSGDYLRTDARVKEHKVLRSCLTEVGKRSFLLGLIGERYPWIPPAHSVAQVAAM